MTDELGRLKELRELSPEIKRMIAVICDANGAHSPAHLMDVAPDAFDELLEAAESMYAQLGAE